MRQRPRLELLGRDRVVEVLGGDRVDRERRQVAQVACGSARSTVSLRLLGRALDAGRERARAARGRSSAPRSRRARRRACRGRARSSPARCRSRSTTSAPGPRVAVAVDGDRAVAVAARGAGRTGSPTRNRPRFSQHRDGAAPHSDFAREHVAARGPAPRRAASSGCPRPRTSGCMPGARLDAAAAEVAPVGREVLPGGDVQRAAVGAAR